MIVNTSVTISLWLLIISSIRKMFSDMEERQSDTLMLGRLATYRLAPEDVRDKETLV